MALTVAPGAQVSADAKLRVGTVTESVTLKAEENGDDRARREGAAASETALMQQLAQRPDDVDAQLALAELLYRDERFAESATAMDRAAALWVTRRRAEAPPPQPTTPSGDINAPQLVRRVNPVYPEAARTAGITGIVIVEAIITEDGTVQDAQVLRGVPMLSDAALGAVQQWLYQPVRLNGVPVPVVMTPRSGSLGN